MRAASKNPSTIEPLRKPCQAVRMTRANRMLRISSTAIHATLRPMRPILLTGRLIAGGRGYRERRTAPAPRCTTNAATSAATRNTIEATIANTTYRPQ